MSSSPSLTKAETQRLRRLGYKASDFRTIDYSELKKIMRKQIRREERVESASGPIPGSAEFLKEQINPLTGTKDVTGLIGEFSDEAIARRNANRPEPSGVQVLGNTYTDYQVADESAPGGKRTVSVITEAGLRDEWMKKNAGSLAAGKGTVFDAAAAKFRQQFPGLAFRFCDAELQARHFAGNDPWEPFVDPATGSRVVVGGQELSYRPREINEQIQRNERQAEARKFRSIAGEVRSTGEAVGAGLKTVGKVQLESGWTPQGGGSGLRNVEDYQAPGS